MMMMMMMSRGRRITRIHWGSQHVRPAMGPSAFHHYDVVAE